MNITRFMASAVAAAVTLAWAPFAFTVTAAESQSLCGGNVDGSRRPVASNFGDDLDYCFDGQRIHISNHSNAVVTISMSGDVSGVRRDESGGSVAASAIAARTGLWSTASTVLPPGYAMSATVGGGAVTVTRQVDEQRSRVYWSAGQVVTGLGFVPFAGMGVDLADGLIKFAAEIEQFTN